LTIMSNDSIANAFSVLNAKNSDKNSNIKMSVLLDWRQEHSRSILAFLGMTSTDIEAANFWNGIFMSRDKTQQESTVQDSCPPSIRWEGIGIPLMHINVMATNRALTLANLETEGKEKAVEVLRLEDEISKEKSDLAKVMLLEKCQSYLITLKQRIDALKRDIANLQEMKNHSKEGKVPAPILVAGLERVTVRYYAKKPAVPHMLGYLAKARKRASCNWDQLRLVAPAPAIKVVNGKDIVQPIPVAVYAALKERIDRDGKNFSFPHAKRTGWKPAELAAYAWCMLINAYNRSWGSTGLVAYPKGFPIDRRFAQATKKSIKTRTDAATAKEQPSEDVNAALKELRALIEKRGNPQSINARYMAHIMELGSQEAFKSVDLTVYAWLALSMARIEAAYDSACRFLDSHRDPKRLDVGIRPKYAEATFVFAEASAVMHDTQRSSIHTALCMWIYWVICSDHEGLQSNTMDYYYEEFDGTDLSGTASYSSEEYIKFAFTYDHIKIGGERAAAGRFSADSSVPRIESVEAKDVPAPVAGPSDLKSVEALLQGAPLFDLESDVDLEEENNRCIEDEVEERERFMEADEIDHKNCVSIPTLCSYDMCPQANAVFQAAEDEAQAKPEASEQAEPDSRDRVWETTPDIPDCVEEDGVSYYRVIESGVTVADPAGSDFLAPNRTAFLSIIRHGRVYIESAIGVRMPKRSDVLKQKVESIPAKTMTRWAEEKGMSVDSLPRTSVPIVFMCESDISPSPSTGTGSPPVVANPKGKGKAVESETTPPQPPAKAKVKLPKAEKAKGKGKEKPESSSKDESKATKGETGNSTGFSDEFLNQFGTFTGKTFSDKEATIDGRRKSEWVDAHIKDEVPKSGKTQMAGCLCEHYPCKHTKRDIAARIISFRDRAWRAAFLHLSGQSDKPPKKKAGANEEPLEKKNPLRAKNVPRSSALTDDQKTALRTFFGLKEAMAPEEFAKLSKEDKNKFRKANSLPHWAMALVLRDEKFLSKITSGKFTKEMAVEELKKAPAKPQSAASKWKALKGKFPDTQLLEKPRTGKQKAFKSAYDRLAKEFPKNPALPKPRKAEGGKESKSAKGAKNSTPSGSASSGDGNLLESLKSIAAILKLFK